MREQGHVEDGGHHDDHGAKSDKKYNLGNFGEDTIAVVLEGAKVIGDLEKMSEAASKPVSEIFGGVFTGLLKGGGSHGHKKDDHGHGGGHGGGGHGGGGHH